MTNPPVANSNQMRYNKNPFIAYPQKNPNKSRFHMPHTWNHDFTIGKLIPMLAFPTMPGDEISLSSEFFFQFKPNYFTHFGMMDMEANYYYVPNRIVWRTTKFTDALGSGDGWEGFITMSAELEHPFINVNMELLADGEANDLVMGYMNLPYITEGAGYDDTINVVNCIPLSAYLLINDTFNRNDKLETGRWFNLEPGDNNSNFDVAFTGYRGDDPAGKPNRYRVLGSKWEWDYFTSCTPTPQLGDPYRIPTTASFDNVTFDGQDPVWRKVSDGTPVGAGDVVTGAGGYPFVGADQVYWDAAGTSGTIKEMRLMEVMQSFKERLLKVGQRYSDYLKGFFGKAPEPGSIDLPLWFGRYTAKVEMTPTYTQANTVVGEATYTTGQYAGNQRLYKRGGDLKMSVLEHGWVIGILEMKPTASYGQGILPWFRWKLPTDYPMDMFSGIGDQEVLKEELMYNNKSGKSALNEGTFGYIERFAHMKTMVNRFGTNLTGYTGKQEWAKSVHDGRYWSQGILDDDTRYNDQIEVNEWFVNMIKHTGTGWPSYTGENGQYRVKDLYKVLTLPYNLGETENPILGLIFHDLTINRALPYHSTPHIGV